MSVRKFIDDTGAAQLNTLLTNKFATKRNINDGQVIGTLESPVRIWGLEDGIYKIPGDCIIYYYGASNTTNKITTKSEGYLLVVAQNTPQKGFFIFYIDTSSHYLIHGNTNAASGSYKNFILSNTYLTSISSYVKNNLTYSTSSSTYALSAYQGYVLNAIKQTKIATDLTNDIVLVDGTAPTLTSGTYYSNGHTISVNGIIFNDLTDSIFYVDNDIDSGSCVFNKLFGPGYIMAQIWYKEDGESEVYTTYKSNPLLGSSIDTSIPNVARDTKVPSTKLLKDQLALKGTYSKPSGGIPKTDLASDVQTSLGKADTAIQDISGKVSKTGDTMTGNLTVSSGGISVTSGYIYGEGNSNTNHAIKLGHNNDDIVKFFEYGGIYEFYKSQSGTNTLLGKINSNGWDGKLGYITATTTDPGAGSSLETGKIILVYQ